MREGVGSVDRVHQLIQGDHHLVEADDGAYVHVRITEEGRTCAAVLLTVRAGYHSCWMSSASI